VTCAQCHALFYDILNIDVGLLTCSLKDTSLPLRHTTDLYAHTHRHESNPCFAYLFMLCKCVGTSSFSLSERAGWSSYDVSIAEWKLDSAKIVALMWRFWSIQKPLKWFGWGNHVENKAKLPCETSVMGVLNGICTRKRKSDSDTYFCEKDVGSWTYNCILFVENILYFPSTSADQTYRSLIGCGAIC
jgi:hypothetical protein